jgi:hypothetical protein
LGSTCWLAEKRPDWSPVFRPDVSIATAHRSGRLQLYIQLARETLRACWRYPPASMRVARTAHVQIIITLIVARPQVNSVIPESSRMHPNKANQQCEFKRAGLTHNEKKRARTRARVSRENLLRSTRMVRTSRLYFGPAHLCTLVHTVRTGRHKLHFGPRAVRARDPRARYFPMEIAI